MTALRGYECQKHSLTLTIKGLNSTPTDNNTEQTIEEKKEEELEDLTTTDQFFSPEELDI